MRIIPQKHAFTLVELLVVIAIIGILIALLLPAIQTAREASRRLECRNHLKQLAMGCVNHESVQKFYPTGGWNWHWFGDPNCGYGRRQPGSWLYNILPYIEQKQMHDYGLGLPTNAKKVAMSVLAQTPLEAFYCPTRRRAMIYPLHDHPANISLPDPLVGANTDYAGNAGTLKSDDTTWWGVPHSGDDDDALLVTITKWPNVNDKNSSDFMNGVCFWTSTIKLKDIRDGSAHTYLIGEKNVNADCYLVSGKDYGNDTTIFAGFDYDFYRWGHNIPVRDRAGSNNYTFFGSAHPMGFNMAFCDGAVQSLSYDIDRWTHELLSNRQDGGKGSDGKSHVIDGKIFGN